MDETKDRKINDTLIKYIVMVLIVGGFVIWIGLLASVGHMNSSVEDFCEEQGYQGYEATESHDYFCYDYDGKRKPLNVDCGFFSDCNIKKGDK